MRLQDIDNMERCSYSNGYHRIVGIIYDINDAVLFQSHDGKLHKLQLNYNTGDGVPTFRYHGVTYRIDEFFKE